MNKTERVTEIYKTGMKGPSGDHSHYEVVSQFNPDVNVQLKFQEGNYLEIGVNGMFTYDLLIIARDRLEAQYPKHPSEAKKKTIEYLTKALDLINVDFGWPEGYHKEVHDR
jgi:hypothetical protein